MLGFNGGLIGSKRLIQQASSIPGVWTPNEQCLSIRDGVWASNFNPVQNFMDDGATAASGGVVPLTGGNPFWIDIDPLNADLDYSGTSSFNRIMDGSLSTRVYWTGDGYTAGRVLRIRLELVPRILPAGELTSLRIYGGSYNTSTTYTPYEARLLDSTKTEISGTNTVLVAPNQWHSIPITGDPYYLEMVPGNGNNQRAYIYAIEVNGTILVDT